MPERLECEVLQKARYINTLHLPLLDFCPHGLPLAKCVTGCVSLQIGLLARSKAHYTLTMMF